LDEYPELLTVNEVADLLRVKPATVYSFRGLVKTRIGNGRGAVRFRKKDVISYINAGVEGGMNSGADHKTQRQRKVGIPALLSWEELQAARVEHEGRSRDSVRGVSQTVGV